MYTVQTTFKSLSSSSACHNSKMNAAHIDYNDIDDLVYTNERGDLHRVDGPAYYCKASGHAIWATNGRKHRLLGPAEIRDFLGGYNWYIYGFYQHDVIRKYEYYPRLNNLLKLTILQNKSRKFNEWLFDPDHYAGRWHKKNMLRDFID